MAPQAQPVGYDVSSIITSNVPASLNPKLWYLHGRAYDFSDFVDRHPGGRKAILIGQGRDCTELFESYHTFLPAASLLEKYVRPHFNVSRKNQLQLAEETVNFQFDSSGFYRTLKQRAAAYFRETQQATKADSTSQAIGLLNVAAIVAFAYFGFYQGSIVCAALCGVARALLIVRDCHACSHYAWSANPTANQRMYALTMALCGSSPAQWTSKHVIAHHVDTNLTPVDDDTMYPIKRVLPELPCRAWHAYQQYYVWAFYCVTLMAWTLSDILKLIVGSYYEGTTQILHWTKQDWVETWGCYTVFVLYRWVLPFVALPLPLALAVVAASETTASLVFVLQFVVNHEVESAVGSVSEDLARQKDHAQLNLQDWGKHQVVTAHNYSVNNKFWLHTSGGLNMQIEHHLFPSVHFRHYPALSELTRATCHEFGVDYNASGNLLEAVDKHYRLLAKMGGALAS